MKPRLAIVGAGASGLAAAWKLRGDGIETVVFEKSRGFGGRAASRTRHGVRLDPGANYLKASPKEVEELVLRQLPTDELVQIEGDVWTFDRGGTLSPGDPEQNRAEKWTYRSGISTLGKLLAAESGVEVRRESRIVGLNRNQDDQWELNAEDGGQSGGFDAVLLTTPAPQAIEILRSSELTGIDRARLAAALGQARFFQQWCFALAFDAEPERPGDFFALINSDRAHPIGWLSFENDKPGRVPPGQTVMIVQMQPDWSASNFDRMAEDLLPEVADQATKLLDWTGREPLWWDAQRWKFAHPFAAADPAELEFAESGGLFFAGDSLVGKGRVNLALATGLSGAERIRDRLG